MEHAINKKEQRDVRPLPHNLSVYQSPYKWTNWWGFWGNIKQFFRNLKFGRQRARRGFADSDVWNLGYHLEMYLINTLTEFRNTTYSWPAKDFKTYEDWIAYIDEIIDLLTYSSVESDEYNAFFDDFETYCLLPLNEKETDEWQKVIHDYLAETDAIVENQKSARKKAFAMLAEYLPTIWS